MKFVFLPAAAMALSACVAQTPILDDQGVSDPASAVAPVRYTSITAGIADYRPVEPRPWVDQNAGVAPRSDAGQ